MRALAVEPETRAIISRPALWVLGVAAVLFVGFGLSFHTSPGPTPFDRTVHDWVHEHLSSEARSVWANGVSAPGHQWTLEIVSVLGGGYVALRGRPWLGLALLAATFLGQGLVHAAKLWVGQPRPETALATSYPSGHAAGVAFVGLLLWFTLGPRGPGRAAWRQRALVGGTAVALLTGVARVLGGVHWPTDLVGGWSFGILYGTAAGILLDEIRRREPVKRWTRDPSPPSKSLL